MPIRLSDIPDDEENQGSVFPESSAAAKPSVFGNKGVRLSDISESDAKGIRLSDIPEEEPLAPSGGGAESAPDKLTLFEKIKGVTMPDVLGAFPFSPWRDWRKSGAEMAERMLKTGDYGPRTRYEMTPMGGYTAVRLPATQKQLKDIVTEQEEREQRGETIPAAIAGGIAQLPAYMIEFGVGGGGKVSGLRQALTTAAKITGLQPHRTVPSILQRVNDGESDVMAIAKGWGDTYIENLSEMAGAAFPVIARKLPFGGRIIDAMHDYAKSIGMKDSAFWNRVATKAGYNGLLNEWGEERVGTIIRGVTGVNDFGAGKDASIADRVAAGLAQDFTARNQLIELGVLAAPAGAKQIASSVFPERAAETESVFSEDTQKMAENLEEIPPGSNVYRGVDSRKIYIETPAQLGAKETQVTEEREDEEGNGRIYSKETGEELMPAFDLSVSAVSDIFAEPATESIDDILEQARMSGAFEDLDFEVEGTAVRILNIETSEEHTGQARALLQRLKDAGATEVMPDQPTKASYGFWKKMHEEGLAENPDEYDLWDDTIAELKASETVESEAVKPIQRETQRPKELTEPYGILKTPIVELSTSELRKRVKKASPYHKLYQQELDFRKREKAPQPKAAKAKAPHITKEEKDALLARGYGLSDILNMTAQEARSKLTSENIFERPPAKLSATEALETLAGIPNEAEIAVAEALDRGRDPVAAYRQVFIDAGRLYGGDAKSKASAQRIVSRIQKAQQSREPVIYIREGEDLERHEREALSSLGLSSEEVEAMPVEAARQMLRKAGKPESAKAFPKRLDEIKDLNARQLQEQLRKEYSPDEILSAYELWKETPMGEAFLSGEDVFKENSLVEGMRSEAFLRSLLAEEPGAMTAMKSVKAIKEVFGKPASESIFERPPGKSSAKTKAGAFITKQEREALRSMGMSLEEIARTPAETLREKLREAQSISGQPPGKPPVETTEAFGEEPEESEDPVSKLTRLLKSAKRAYSPQHEAAEAELGRRIARFGSVLEKGEGDTAFIRARAQLAGPLRAPEFTPPGQSMSEAEIAALSNSLKQTGNLMPLEKLSAWEGLKQLLAGNVPQPNQLSLLERAFGKEFAKAALAQRSRTEKAVTIIADVANFPRTLLTAYDLSNSLRQSVIVAVSHPTLWTKAMKAQLKALGSQRAAEVVDTSIRRSAHYPSAVKYKLYLPDVSSISQIVSERPEEFMSRLARYIPGVKASERTFITMGNKLRFELWSKYMELWKDAKRTEEDYRNLAKYINAVTGRGNLPQFLHQHGAALNALFFSPRFLFSRLQVLYEAAKFPVRFISGQYDPVAAIAAGDVMKFAAATLILLTLTKLALGDDGDVEADPRSSDFAKIHIGNTRFDVFGGYQPIMRYAAQLLTGQIKTTVGGDVYKKGRLETAGRFLRSKLAPVPSFIVDLHTGRTYVGDEMAASKWKEQLYTRFFPLSVQDIRDAARYQSPGMMIPVLPAAILGIGTQTWQVTSSQKARLLKNELGQQYFGKKWSDLNMIQQQFIRAESDKIDELERQGRIEGTGRFFSDDSREEQINAGRFIEQELPSHIIEDMHSVGVTVGALSRNISRDWSLNDRRYANYQKYTANELKEMLEVLTGSQQWQRFSYKQKQLFYEEAIRRARANARERLMAESIFPSKPVGAGFGR